MDGICLLSFFLPLFQKPVRNYSVMIADEEGDIDTDLPGMNIYIQCMCNSNY